MKRQMKPGAAFAILFGLLTFVLVIAAIWTADAATLSGKLTGTAFLFGLVTIVAAAGGDWDALYRDCDDE